MRFDEYYLEEDIINSLKSKAFKLDNAEAQEIMTSNSKRFKLWNEIVEKGKSKDPNRFIEIYVQSNVPFVYLIYGDDYFTVIKDNDGSVKASWEGKSNVKTKHIFDIEVASDKGDELKGIGAEIIKDFIKQSKTKGYDYITLQANNDYLLNKYYPELGFKPFKEDVGNGMYYEIR